jgi:hypothetical protein
MAVSSVIPCPEALGIAVFKNRYLVLVSGKSVIDLSGIYVTVAHLRIKARNKQEQQYKKG